MTQRLRVMLLDNSIATTGAYRSAVAMAQAIRRGAETRFMLPNAPSLQAELSALGFASDVLPMVEIGRSLRRLVTYAPMLVINGIRLKRRLVAERIDTLVANDYYNLLPAMVRLMGWRGRIITIVRLLPAHQQPLLNRLWIAAMRFASNRIVAVSVAVRNQLPETVRAEVVYFPVGRGLESLPFVPAPGQSDGAVEFLYLANYIQGKGQEHGLAAFAIVASDAPTARLRFVGGDMGLQKNADYRDALKAEAGRLGMGGRVDFRGATEDVVHEIQAVDVVLNFSESESFSHTCVEAGLLGRPVIATRCGGPEEIIEHGETGLLVDRGHVEEMAAAMRRLVESADLRTELGRTAWTRTRERFGEAGFAATMLRLLTDGVCN